MTSAFRKALATVCTLPATISIATVRLYQSTLSPDHGLIRHLYPYGFCRHEPTCSEYAIQKLMNSPYPLALLRILKRLVSCHPWHNPSDEKIRAMIQKLDPPKTALHNS